MSNEDLFDRFEALTFDDVVVVPGYTEVLPDGTDVSAPFARDLRVALDAGWTVRSLRAFDLFPMTEHVELVAILEPPTGSPA